MIKLILILLLILTGCQKEITYIKPVAEPSLFSYLSEETADLIYQANGGKEMDNHYLLSIGKQFPSMTLQDIRGKEISLQDGLILLEVSSATCSHCLRQTQLFNPELMLSDMTLVQYFKDGDKEDIEDFYASLTMDEEEYIIPAQDGLNAFLDSLNPDYIPSYFLLRDGEVFFASYGYLDGMSLSRMLMLKDVSIDLSYLKDHYRDQKDVFSDLTKEDQDYLSSLSSKNLTLSLLGQDADYDSLHISQDDNRYNHKDFSSLKDKDVIFYYLYFSDSSAMEIEALNSFKKKHKNIELILVIKDMMYEGSSSLRRYDDIPVPYEGLTIGDCFTMPNKLFELNIQEYPCAVFIEKGTFTGALTKDFSLEEELPHFFGDDAFAHQR